MRISDWSSDVCSSDLSRVVSMPSRATETNPSAMSAHTLPACSARSMPPSRLERSVRPARCIQKIIHVTMPTATSDSPPPISSWASKVSEYVPKVSTAPMRSEEHTSELQSLMRISYAVFCLKKKTTEKNEHQIHT